MAQIRSVVYTELPDQAKQIRGKAGELNTKLHTIYQSVDTMRAEWYGKRYNDLVSTFNGMVPSLNQIVDLMFREVPSTLETIANNYSNVDRGSNITTVDNTPANRLQDIPNSTEVGMRFQTNPVTETKAKCNSLFAEVVTNLNELQTLVTNLSWDSDASVQFRDRFQSLKNSIIASIEDVKAKFEQTMQQALADMQATETANTVG